MPTDSSHDPRDRLVREKYFTLRPKPLERWLWQQGLPPAAERVFWLHWEEGMRNRSWCSEIPLRRVARECCIDTSTVTRAYQWLKARGLIRREDPGRDSANPFQQATAVTEVRVPRELLSELSRHPSRRHGPAASPANVVPTRALMASEPDSGVGKSRMEESVSGAPDPHPRRFSRAEIQATLAKLSDAERARFFTASRNQTGTVTFDTDSRLSPEEQAFVLRQLQQSMPARTSGSESVHSVHRPTVQGTSARLSLLELARARRAIGTYTATAQQAAETLRQVVWAVEEGALRSFGTLKGLNVALKKIREGAWTRPHRMPPNWQRVGAAPETCRAA
jgi:hypothetical protein